MQFLTLELQKQELGPDRKQCVVCGKIFKRRYNYLSWSIRKCCSKVCRGKRLGNKPGIRLGNNHRVFTCSICGQRIIGDKYRLKKHKNRRHSY